MKHEIYLKVLLLKFVMIAFIPLLVYLFIRFLSVFTFQLMNSLKPWKSRDYHRFLEILRDHNLPHKHKILPTSSDDSMESEPTLETHFDLLRQFPIDGAD